MAPSMRHALLDLGDPCSSTQVCGSSAAAELPTLEIHAGAWFFTHGRARSRDPGVKPYVACRRCHQAKMVDTRPENIAAMGVDMLSPYRKKDV